MNDRIRFFLHRIQERLWLKPLVMCILSILAAFLARMADHIEAIEVVPEITSSSIETLLSISSASMLIISVFAVGAMLSAYESAIRTATPRSFPLVIADDVSQNALSTFIGAFIFSIVALIALMNGYYEQTGRFFLFLFTIVVFAIVIINFLRWVDRIARLGRPGPTIDKVEKVAEETMRRRRKAPTLGARKAEGDEAGLAIYADAIGYVQRIDVATLQALAEKGGFQVTVAALPGTFSSPGQPLAYVTIEKMQASDEVDTTDIVAAFLIGDDRLFDEDPRFGLVVLSEIASHALSPAVNDPGTAIDIIGTYVRLFTLWVKTAEQEEEPPIEFDRVAVPEISLNDMFDDAFNAISRDGAGTIEVAIRLQKAFASLASLDDMKMEAVSRTHARLALRHAETTLKLPEEIEIIRCVSGYPDSRGQQQASLAP